MADCHVSLQEFSQYGILISASPSRVIGKGFALLIKTKELNFNESLDKAIVQVIFLFTRKLICP